MKKGYRNTRKPRKSKRSKTKRYVGGERKPFKTIPNDGTAEGCYKNQCMWVSIRDYFIHYLNYPMMSVTKLRLIAETLRNANLNKRTKFWDIDNNLNGLLYISLIFGLHIRIYRVVDVVGEDRFIEDEDVQDLNNIQQYIQEIKKLEVDDININVDSNLLFDKDKLRDFQNKNREVHIASFGYHFELIKEIDRVPIIEPIANMDLFSDYFYDNLDDETREIILSILDDITLEGEASNCVVEKTVPESRIESKEKTIFPSIHKKPEDIQKTTNVPESRIESKEMTSLPSIHKKPSEHRNDYTRKTTNTEKNPNNTRKVVDLTIYDDLIKQISEKEAALAIYLKKNEDEKNEKKINKLIIDIRNLNKMLKKLNK